MSTYEEYRIALIDTISKNPPQHVYRIRAKTVEDVYQKAVEYFNIPLEHIRFEIEEAGVKENKDNVFEIGSHTILAYPSSEFLKKENVKENENKDGEVFVRLSKGLIFMMVTPPKQDGNEVTFSQAVAALKMRLTTERADRSIIRNVVKNKKERWVQIGEFVYSGGDNDAKCNARVGENNMAAFILLKSPGEGGSDLTVDEMKFELESLGVQRGLDEKALNDLERKPVYNQWVKVASGIPVKDGIDAKIILVTKKQSRVKKTGDDKKEKELHSIVTVKKNTLVAIKQPMVEGVNGVTVLGEVIFPKEAKDVELEETDNVSISEDGLQAFAKKDGAVYLKGNKIIIEELWVIEGDISKVGNIEFPGSVIVYGDIPPGHVVKVDGNLEVHGGLTSANVFVGGNLLVSRGIHPQNVEVIITVEGSLLTRFIESSNIRVKGDCVVDDAIINSTISSDNRIIAVGGRGRVVNTVLVSPTHIQVKNVGSMMGSTTSLKILSLYDEREKVDKINQRIIEKRKELAELKAFLGDNVESIKNVQVDSQQKKVFVEKANRVKVLKTELQKLNSVSEKAKEYLKNMQTNGKIIVEGQLQDGTTIVIDEKSMEFQDKIRGGVFYMRDGVIAQRVFDARFDSLNVGKIKKDVFQL